MWRNSENSYGIVSKSFHWVLGLSYIGILAVGFIMAGMEKGDAKYTLYGLHKAFGVTLLLLVSLRIIWRMMSINPASLNPNNKIGNLLAKSVHLLLYVLMFAMPLSGVIMSVFGGYDINVFNLFTIPGLTDKNMEVSTSAYNLHVNAALLFVGFIVLHILASLFHHYYRKDKTLTRMLPW